MMTTRGAPGDIRLYWKDTEDSNGPLRKDDTQCAWIPFEEFPVKLERYRGFAWPPRKDDTQCTWIPFGEVPAKLEGHREDPHGSCARTTRTNREVKLKRYREDQHGPCAGMAPTQG